MGSYVFRWPYPAGDVHVTGTFDDWSKSEQLYKVGDVWEKEVQLPSADEKILYKFVVDDQWIVDDGAPKEDDGHYNVNNVLLPADIKRREQRWSTPGAFPETPAHEPESFSVQPIPASSGTGNPISLPAGATVPQDRDVSAKNIDSTVTTSKEDYERAGSSDYPAGDETVSVQPIPASRGSGNPISVPAGSTVPDDKNLSTAVPDTAVTTSKDDYEKAGSSDFPVDATTDEQTFSVQPIPASAGLGNPVSIPAGESLPKTDQINAATVDSTVTTSKEDYEKAGTSAFPAFAAAGLVGTAAAGATAATAFHKSDQKENLIPESSLPMGGKDLDTLDAGPFVSSVAPGSTTAELASKVPLEEKREATVVDPSADPSSTGPLLASAAPGSTTSELASKVPFEDKRQATVVDASTAPSSEVPEVVKSSIAQAHQDPEAAASSEAVREKLRLESELLEKTKTSEATGEPASTAAQQTSYHGLATTVPKAVESSIAQAHAAPEAAADRSAVAEKAAVEQELLSTIRKENDSGEPAPVIAAATSATAPAATETKPIGTSVPAVSDSTVSGGATNVDLANETAPQPAAQSSVGAVSSVHHATTDTSSPAGDASTTLPTTTTDRSTTTSGTSAAPVTSTKEASTIGKSSTTAASAATAASGVPTVTDVGTGGTKAETKKLDTSVAAAESKAPSAPSTPSKPTQVTSPIGSPVSQTSTANTERKKKHRLSTFIKKVFHHGEESK